MNILHITDSHGAPVAPKNRSDMYYIAFLKKLTELRYIIQKEKIDLVIHTGDLFHRSRVSNKFMGQTAKIIKSWSAPLYVVPGNHDIDGYNLGTIDQTSLGLLERTGIFKLLTRNTPIKFKEGNYTIAISGQEYYQDIDSGNMEDFEMQQDLADINILAIHGYIANTPQHPDIKCTYTKDIVSDADVILSGHYHESFVEERDDISFYNPGSMMRVEGNTYNQTHMPQYGILRIDNSSGNLTYEYELKNFICAEPFEKVFNQVNMATHKLDITLDKFKENINNVIQSITNVDTSKASITEIEKYIDAYTTSDGNASPKDELIARATYIYNKATQDVQDEDNVTVKGFIPSHDIIKIKSIDMENFQVHSNTHIDFTDGLNIITGESNNGKSSILRAMDWVTDNYPLGNEFIQTGKKHCKVRITYSNNVFIERYRTIKDTGYYRVGTILPDGTEQFDEYQGFTNNVPVEVMNAHQMPKVNITKNIETHLNKIGQLESPFLITDSVNEKAAAIGKITGTDVIDAGIKIIASDIASDKKTLKSLLGMQEDTKKKMDDIKIDDVNAKRDRFVDYGNKVRTNVNLITKSNDFKQKHAQLLNNRDTYTQTIKDSDSIILLKQPIAEAQLKILTCTRFINLYNDYHNCNNTASNIESSIREYDKTIAKAEQVKKLQQSIQLLNTLIDIYERYSKAVTKEVTMKKCISDCDKVLAITDKVRSIDINKINKMINIYISYTDNTRKMADISNSINFIENEIANNNTSLIIVKKELNDFILSNKICPCCGQNITESHVQDIIKSLGGN